MPVLRAFFLFFSALAVHGAIPKQQIVNQVDSRFLALQNAGKWHDYIKVNARLFPEPSTTPLSVNVEPTEIKVKNEPFTLGVGFRQVTISATIARVKTLLSRPDLFQALYGLDAPTAPAMSLQPGDTLPAIFEAHILKRIPILPNQDYVFRYRSSEDSGIWFQRINQVRDEKDFALRESLIAVEPYKDKTVFREIGEVYPLLWTVRALGPQLRSVMKSELTKISLSFKCASESKAPLSQDLAKSCWKEAQ